MPRPEASAVPSPNVDESPALLATLERVLRGRRSVRRYQEAPVPRAAVERALATAALAPSPHHSAPWRFAVLTRRTAKATLARAMGAAWRDDLARDGVSAARIRIVLDRSFERIAGAPVVVVLCITEARLDHYPDAPRQAAERAMAAQS